MPKDNSQAQTQPSDKLKPHLTTVDAKLLALKNQVTSTTSSGYERKINGVIGTYDAAARAISSSVENETESKKLIAELTSYVKDSMSNIYDLAEKQNDGKGNAVFRVAVQRWFNPKAKHRQIAVSAIKNLMNDKLVLGNYQGTTFDSTLGDVFGDNVNEATKRIEARYGIKVTAETKLSDLKREMGFKESKGISQSIKELFIKAKETTDPSQFMNFLTCGLIIAEVKENIAEEIRSNKESKIPDGLGDAFIKPYVDATRSDMSRTARAIMSGASRMAGFDTRGADQILAEQVIDSMQTHFVAFQLLKRGGLQESHINDIAAFRDKVNRIDDRKNIGQVLVDVVDLVFTHIGAVLVDMFGSEIQKAVNDVKSDIRADMRNKTIKNFQDNVEGAMELISKCCSKLQTQMQQQINDLEKNSATPTLVN